jgi:hypothetical protein
MIFSVPCLRAFRLHVVSNVTHHFLFVDYVRVSQSLSHFYILLRAT